MIEGGKDDGAWDAAGPGSSPEDLTGFPKCCPIEHEVLELGPMQGLWGPTWM